MLQVNSRSWHLRMVRFFNSEYAPKDLCSYFWTIVWTLVVGAIFLASLPLWPLGVAISRGTHAMNYSFSLENSERFYWSFKKQGRREGARWAFGLTVALLIAGYFYNTGFLLRDQYHNTIAGVAFLTLGTAAFFVIGIIMLTAFFGILPDPRPSVRGEKAPSKTRKPNLLVEFVKAKKRRACPLIEIVE